MRHRKMKVEKDTPSRPLVCAVLGKYYLLKIMGLGYISVISWRSVLLVEETGVPRKDH
jgi:hypothetical protein